MTEEESRKIRVTKRKEREEDGAEIHSPLSASFFDHYYVRQPVKVVYLPYKARFLQFSNLFHYGSISFQGEHSFLLSDRGKGRRHIQPMYDD